MANSIVFREWWDEEVSIQRGKVRASPPETYTEGTTRVSNAKQVTRIPVLIRFTAIYSSTRL